VGWLTIWLGWASWAVPTSPSTSILAPLPDLSSPQEAALWRDAIRVNDELVSAVADKVVLLVVDASSSQWPITVAAAHLRKAQASMVLPLLVHRRP